MREQGLSEMISDSTNRLDPFDERPICFACGANPKKGILANLRARWHGVGFIMQDVSFCAGNRPPSETRDVVTALIGVVTQERNNDCYEFVEPHLHVRCRQCGAHWWMKLKGKP